MTKRKKPEDFLKNGAPKFPYTEELAKEICKGISTSSDSLKTLCKANPHWPCYKVIFGWIREQPGFSNLYALAKQEQAAFLVDELLDTAKSSVDSDSASCNRLVIDTSKWLASKLIPKVYGSLAMVDELKGQNEQMMKELLALRAELAVKNKKEF